MKLTKGATRTIIFEDPNQDFTGWKIRVELWDTKTNCVKLATTNSGGADTQVEVLNSTQFAVYIASGATTDFEDKGFIEIEADTGETVGGQPELLTIFTDKIHFIPERITWVAP